MEKLLKEEIERIKELNENIGLPGIEDKNGFKVPKEVKEQPIPGVDFEHPDYPNHNGESPYDHQDPTYIGNQIYKQVKGLIDEMVPSSIWEDKTKVIPFYERVLDSLKSSMYEDLADSVDTRAGSAPDEIPGFEGTMDDLNNLSIRKGSE